MNKHGTIRKTTVGVCALAAAVCMAVGISQLSLTAQALISPVTTDLIASSAAGDWFQNAEGEPSAVGTWNVTAGGVTAETFGTAYAMEGATYLTSAGQAYGAYEMEATVVINELNNVENPMVGIIPWYRDEGNYLFVQLKFTNASSYQTTAEERADGYALQEIIVSGRLDGEAKYNTATSQQENNSFDALTVAAIGTAKRNPLSPQGHTIKVEAENSASTGNYMKFTVYYNGVSVGYVSAYYYNKIARTSAMGFMAQDVKATFAPATFTDGYAENKTASLARDWMTKEDFTYRTLNGFDAWTFNGDGSVSMITTTTEDGRSGYSVTGTNFAGYNTNRGYTRNPYASTNDGLPQNYEISASFQGQVAAYATAKEYKLGYGLLAWYQDDQNFVSATIRRTESGKVGFSTVKHEVVLYGWIDGSNLGVGTSVYTLPDDFDETVSHTIRVEKKSIGFYVYLDDGAEAVISKRISGTEINYYYGYEGYNVDFTASAITGKAIYSPYDEISVYDEDGNIWKTAGKSQTAWTFANGEISLSAAEPSAEQTARSYLVGTSDITDKNAAVTANVTFAKGTDAQFSELMLSPYIVDEYNFVRAGLVFRDGSVYARIYACTFTEDDEMEGKDPCYTLKEYLLSVDLGNTFTLSAQKVGKAIGIVLNGDLVFGLEINDIDSVAEEIGVYVYNADATIHSLNTEGYKKYTRVTVGDWITSGIKNNQWTINSDGWLIADATYSQDMTAVDADDDKSWAIQANPNENYTLTMTVRVTAESRAEDRVGVMAWYLDEENYLMFYMDRWRSDSAVARTTFTGLIGGEYLPTRYNHGGWFYEGDTELENGMTRTEMSQLTQWHTITVIKLGNNFTCSVDDGKMGYISYTVAAGLPSANGKTVYSGVYALNDAIEVSEWAVTPEGGTVALSTPASPSQATVVEEETLALGTYTASDYRDEFDGVTTSDAQPDNGNDGNGGNPPDNTENPPTSDKPDEGGGNVGMWVGIGIAIAVVVAGAVVAVVLVKKKSNQKSKGN